MDLSYSFIVYSQKTFSGFWNSRKLLTPFIKDFPQTVQILICQSAWIIDEERNDADLPRAPLFVNICLIHVTYLI